MNKKLKDLARKHDIVIVSPYQIDATGEARFAKGILDAADIALVMEAHEKDKGAISFMTTKIRGGAELSCTSPIDWSTLRISPASMEIPKDEPKKKKKSIVKDDSNADIPWDV